MVLRKVVFGLATIGILASGTGCAGLITAATGGLADKTKVSVQLSDAPRHAIPVSMVKLIDRREVAKAILGDEKDFKEVGPGLIAKYQHKYLSDYVPLATINAKVTGSSDGSTLTKDIVSAILKKSAKLGGTVFLVSTVDWHIASGMATALAGQTSMGRISGQVLVKKGS